MSSSRALFRLVICIVATTSFFLQCIVKKLLDSVFVISGIIKVLVRVISAASAALP